jgi:acid phosphatase
MPYFNSLAEQNSLATAFYANVHPSIGNYFMMTTGAVVNTDDSFAGTFPGENVASQLGAAGKSWRVYAQSLPTTGYIDGDQYPYIKHHNPFAYFDNVRGDSVQRNNLVSLAQLSSDNTAETLPSYSFVVPDNLNNGHDCPTGGSSCPLSDRLAAIDSWLQIYVRPLLANPAFVNTGVVIITFDESATDNTLGGGHIPVVLAGGKIKTNFQSTGTYQFPSLLRFSLESLGQTSFPGDAATAPDMNEFLN